MNHILFIVIWTVFELFSSYIVRSRNVARQTSFQGMLMTLAQRSAG